MAMQQKDYSQAREHDGVGGTMGWVTAASAGCRGANSGLSFMGGCTWTVCLAPPGAVRLTLAERSVAYICSVCDQECFVTYRKDASSLMPDAQRLQSHGAVSDETCFLAEQQGRRGEQEMGVLEFDPACKVNKALH